jgi:hypothetical protein
MEKKDSNGAEGTREDRTRHRRWKRMTRWTRGNWRRQNEAYEMEKNCAMDKREQKRTERGIGDGKEGQ